MKRVLAVALLLFLIGIPQGCKPKPNELDRLLVEGRYDELISLGEKRLKDHPDDYGVMILIGDAYFFKAKKINEDRGSAYTPEGAALAKKAIDYYRKSSAINRSQRVDRKIGFAGALMSPP